MYSKQFGRSNSGRLNQDALLDKIKAAVVKKISIFLYRKDFHQLSQGRGVDPERFTARIKQAALACKFMADGGTPNYGADLMSTIFILGQARGRADNSQF